MSYVPPSHQGIFQLKRNTNGTSWDVVDTRTATVVLADQTLDAAQADAITRNKTLNPLG